jgi:YhcH/YjgK/YiaL family protein
MIIDRIDNAHLYNALHPNFKRAFDYIHQINVETIPAGRYEIDADVMYAMVQEYNTKPKDQGKWEAHRRYIDLQYIVRGAENIGHAKIHQLQQGEYDANKDFLPLDGDGNFFTLQSGYFVLLLPEDAHMPGLAVASPAPVKKIVVKIAVGQ